ncbi:AFR165Cp [Eremothecium gossypii ATCC 10895]|uniref:AFR165Cp n=1 Tax=Eremothecium gossypii (strain ATCC 10895 / CBS 109.51 / FGSC 9923 / NRRL Y-1056) TaxID=284811 RepID=Q754A7_EREGS|nr:AFR165Cp [Eremothecium gossypii ATCC 10895]AAS53536.1 AFR165Cp [Eremothecium gossypii ATCC 10895]AEY97849.1 FAFR165Cp [Eremothecium gossypii FDAG1]
MRIAATFSLLFLAIFQVSWAHNVLLPPYGRRCFFEQLKGGDVLTITYQFGDRDPQSHQQLSGDLLVYGIDGRSVLDAQRASSHGELTLKAPTDGKYQYCFANDNSGYLTKDVTFNTYGVLSPDAADSSSETLEGAVRKLSMLTMEVMNEQQYIEIRERTHRNTAESTNDRVKWWSIFQLAVVVAQSLFQVYYLRSFFEVTSYV